LLPHVRHWQHVVRRNNLTDASTLSISSPHITDCREVADYLRQCQIVCHVTPNDTVVRTDATTGACAIEHGCQIKCGGGGGGSHSSQLLSPYFWARLQTRFGLDCAHLEVEGKYRGCICDFFRKSECPGI
jgi:hypothetical protein